MIKTIDAITEFFGKLSAWIYFFIGLIVTYEVVMRYVFTRPTIWVDDISRIAQIWATYIGIAFALKHRDMIVIDVAFKDHHSIIRKILETFSLVVIIVFSGIVIYYGYQIWLYSTLKGHTTGSYLSIPKWFTQAPILVGFTLLLIQALAEIIKVWTIGIAFDEESEMVKESV